MSLFYIRRRLLRLCEKISHNQWYGHKYSTETGDGTCDQVSLLMRLCGDRYFIPSDAFHSRTCIYGPLGVELKNNILEQWWTSTTRSRGRVFGINTSVHRKTCAESVMLVNYRTIQDNFQQDSFTREEALREVHQNSQYVRSSLLQGALQQYIQISELVNKKLPFGLAEIGLCHQSDDQSVGHSPGCLSEVTESSLVWFCSPRTSSQWMDYWARQRLQWWRKRHLCLFLRTPSPWSPLPWLITSGRKSSQFALGPYDFSLCDVLDKDLKDGTSRGIKVLYKFPWGLETLETLWSLGSTELQKTYQGTDAKLQCRDGRKVVIPHVISVSGNMDKGILAYLFNSLQLLKKTDSKQKLLQRTVLKLHPTLTPVKVALDMGRGSNSELRQVCEGLLQEFLEGGIPTWPGYLDTLPSSLDNLHIKYDEMGVLFTVLVSETTLQNGLLLVRNRDTTIRETMHISEIKKFLLGYISASDNL